jgi:Raf kinase inhibitor-like YbhB/YbcL family protein
MTRKLTALGTIVLASGIGALAQGTAKPQGGGAQTPGLTLTTPAFADGSEIPLKYTQAVPAPVSPRLEWTNVPANTVSFVLNMLDPDTALKRTTDTVVHWVAFNIPGSTRELPEGVPGEPKLPDGTIQLRNQGGVPGYRGPGAPAAGPHHHYTWELYALDTMLELGPDATRADVLKAIDGHILGKAVLVGRFHRP